MGLQTLEDDSVFANRYKIIHPIGRGGMGEVYLAADQFIHNELIALKILLVAHGEQEKQSQRFLREIQLARKVNHPNIIRTFDSGTHNEQLYFTMEYIKGESLQQRIKRGPMPWQEVCSIIIEVANGLQALHDQSIIHRDLKPGNILVSYDGAVKLTDFGVARPINSNLTKLDELVGSANYMAPEMWSGREVSPATDLYALGVTAYELITGCLPFEADNPAELMWKHLKGVPVPPYEMGIEVPDWFNDLILALLKKDEGCRPIRASEIALFVNTSMYSGAFPGTLDPVTTAEAAPNKERNEKEDFSFLNPAPLVDAPPTANLAMGELHDDLLPEDLETTDTSRRFFEKREPFALKSLPLAFVEALGIGFALYWFGGLTMRRWGLHLSSDTSWMELSLYIIAHYLWIGVVLQTPLLGLRFTERPAKATSSLNWLAASSALALTACFLGGIFYIFEGTAKARFLLEMKHSASNALASVLLIPPLDPTDWLAFFILVLSYSSVFWVVLPKARLLSRHELVLHGLRAAIYAVFTALAMTLVAVLGADDIVQHLFRMGRFGFHWSTPQLFLSALGWVSCTVFFVLLRKEEEQKTLRK